MKLALISAAAVGACLLGMTGLAAVPAQAQPADAATPAAKPPATVPGRPNVEVGALDALSRMGSYLRGLNTFQIISDVSVDTDIDGQLITFDGTTTYKVRKPDAFFIEMNTDRKIRAVYYDGKKVTVYAPRTKLYATVDAPATIRDTLKMAEQKYAIELPLTDLFRWGTPEARTDQITTATYLGPARCGDGDVCDQYAFQETDLDWQIWIQRGDQPLPRKVVITTKLDDSDPHFTARLDWTLNPSLTDADFTFTPPADAHAIQLVEASLQK